MLSARMVARKVIRQRWNMFLKTEKSKLSQHGCQFRSKSSNLPLPGKPWPSLRNPTEATALLASVAMLASLAGLTFHEESNDPDDERAKGGAEDRRPPGTRIAQCDPLATSSASWLSSSTSHTAGETSAQNSSLPFQRRSQKSHDPSTSTQPYSPHSPSLSKYSLFHRRSKQQRQARGTDMNTKYDIDWKHVLGEGAYGRVHPARVVATGEKVALKKISKRYTNSASFRSETDALLRIYENGGETALFAPWVWRFVL